MATKYESRIGKVPHAQEKIYGFLADFRNFNRLIPEDRIENWEAGQDSCSFSVQGVGNVGLKMVEKRPGELLKFTGDSSANIGFTLWIQIKEATPGDSRVKVTLEADLNPMIRVVAAQPLKQFLEILVGYIEKFDFDAGVLRDA